MNITVVCIDIEHPGNLGAICRVMKNFSFTDLLLINPQCAYDDEVARCRAKHANDILSNVRIADSWEALEEFDYTVGLIGDIGSDYNIPRSPLLPEELAQKLAQNPNTNVALVFGPEGYGLQNHHVRDVDFVVTIQTNKECPSMNLSHAVGTILYELSKKRDFDKLAQDIEKCGNDYKRVLHGMISETIELIDFGEERKADTQKIVWRKIIGKSMPTKREAFALIGYFKQLLKELDKKNTKP